MKWKRKELIRPTRERHTVEKRSFQVILDLFRYFELGFIEVFNVIYRQKVRFRAATYRKTSCRKY